MSGFRDGLSNSPSESIFDVAFAELIDDYTSATYTYICEASPGTLTSAASWRIQRITNATGRTEWADGDANFDNIADNRATTVVYS